MRPSAEAQSSARDGKNEESARQVGWRALSAHRWVRQRTFYNRSLLTYHHTNMRGTSFRILCAKNILSSTRHVSFLAVPDTYHQHKFTLTYLSNLTVILFYTPKLVVSRSVYGLRRFTAELRFLGSPNSHSCNTHRIAADFRTCSTRFGHDANS